MFKGNFQVSIFERSDLAGLNYSRIDTVFVRFEYLLYGVIAKTREYPGSLNEFQPSVREELIAIARDLPRNATLLVRGVDVRSDDQLLSRYFFDKRETNPELGQHGTKYLLNRPEIIEFIATVLHDLPCQVQFACPFVTTYREYENFAGRYSSLFDNPALVPFAESPAIFEEVTFYKVDKLCIGLKDLTQFYFAADRNNPHTVNSSSYLDRGLISALVRAIRIANQNNTKVYLYQQSNTLGTYAKALRGLQWVPSMTTSDLRLLE